MNILALNLPCAAPSHGPTYRTHHLAEIWAKAGHNVTFVGSSYSHLLTNPPRMTGPIWEGVEAGVRYVLVKTPAYSGSGIGRVLNLLTGLARLNLCRRRIIGPHVPDIVLAASVYQVDNHWAWRTSRRSGGRFVRETRDLWPMTLTQLGGQPAWHPFVQWVQRGEDLGYRRANLVSTTLADAFPYMESRGLDASRWIWLPQCPPPGGGGGDTLPTEHQEALAKAAACGHFIVGFTGSLVPAADLDTALNAARRLAGRRVSIFLVGQGPEEPRLRRRIQAEGIGDVTLLPPVPKAAVPAILRRCHAGLHLFPDLAIYRYGVSPNKVFDYLQNGLPAILGTTAPTNPISASGGGFVIRPGDPEALASTILKLQAMDAPSRAALGQRGREHVRRHHDLEHVGHKYLECFEAIRATPPQAGHRSTGSRRDLPAV